MITKTYPEIGFLRLRDVIGDRNNSGIIPVGNYGDSLLNSKISKLSP